MDSVNRILLLNQLCDEYAALLREKGSVDAVQFVDTHPKVQSLEISGEELTNFRDEVLRELIHLEIDLLEPEVSLKSLAEKYPDLELEKLYSQATSQGDKTCEQCGSAYSEQKTSVRKCATCGSLTLVEREAADQEMTDILRRIPARFQLQRRIGEGAFGIVFKSWDSILKRFVAIKVPKQGVVARELFAREARSASQLNHENVVKIFDVCVMEDITFIVSEFIEGLSLNRWMQLQNLSVRETCQLVLKICNAMGHAHRQGVVHRDLKPSNVVMDLTGQPHILDFGLSRSRIVSDSTFGQSGRPIGTPAYMSPEQVRGEVASINAQSDVFSLGVLLFQLLSGVLPFNGETSEVYDAILNTEAKPLHELNQSVPKRLNSIVNTAMAKVATERYADASDLAADLQRFLDHKRLVADNSIDRDVLLGQARKLAAPAIVVASLALAAFIFGRNLWRDQQNDPRIPVRIEASESNTALAWYRFDESTGREDTLNAMQSNAGEVVRLAPGFYRVQATNRNQVCEVYRTVPSESDTRLNLTGISLNHRLWEYIDDVVVLPTIEFVESNLRESAVLIRGADLAFEDDKSHSHFIDNHASSVDSFWVSEVEYDMAAVKEVNPDADYEQVNFEIAIAFAEQVGATLPTLDDYLLIEQERPELPGLLDGPTEWTATPMLNISTMANGTPFELPADIRKRIVISSTSHPQSQGQKTLKHTLFLMPTDCLNMQGNSSFRLKWLR